MATTAPERKTNERTGPRSAPLRPGARAQVKHVRCSAYKAREVLDLIRGKHVSQALEVLEFSERSISAVILKCLESAIANAQNNEGIPDQELFVSACFADEGPTIKRWRPRARGRATRIRKRTCHVTIIVSKLDTAELEALREREAAAGRGNVAAAEARRRRVLRSRSEKAERKAAEKADHDHDHDDGGHDHDHEVSEVEGQGVDASAGDVGPGEEADLVVTDAAVADSEAADSGVADHAVSSGEADEEDDSQDGQDSSDQKDKS